MSKNKYKEKNRKKRQRKHLLANGLCETCGKPAQKSKTRCKKCQDRNNELGRTLRKKRRDLGLCMYCNNPSNKSTCLACRRRSKKSHKKRRKELYELGICIQCRKKPSDGSIAKCRSCQDKCNLQAKKRTKLTKIERKEKRERFLANGLCSQCGKCPVVKGRTLCKKHLLKKSEYARNPDSKKSKKERLLKIKDEVYNHYGGYRCNCCGEKEKSFLSIDHILNNGGKLRKEGQPTGSDLCVWLKKHNFPKEYQILCMNCQWGKRLNKGICPHQNPREREGKAR